MKKEDQSLTFFVIAMIGIWLILDEIYGKKRITQFLSMLFPFVQPPGEKEA